MAKRFVNTFNGGIDKDTSVNKYDNQHYYDAENIRIISNDTFSSGAVTNMNGLYESLRFETANYTNENLPGSFSLSRGTIYGIATIRDRVVFLGTFSAQAYSPYLEDTTTVLDVDMILSTTVDEDGNFGSVTIHYAYKDDEDGIGLHFNRDMAVVGRYESEDIQKVYWVNGIDPLRFYNLSEDNININYLLDALDLEQGLTIKYPSSLDHVPDVNFSRINIDDILEGGNYTAGVVQYAYQLYNKNGNVSTISPVTNPVYLASSNRYEIGGNDIGEEVSKSVKISIEDIDDRFNRIKVFALFSDTIDGNPTVNVIYEGENKGSLDLIDTNTPVDTLTYEEFLVFNNTTYIPNSIESKNNILFLGNVKEATFQSEAIDNWDSRAYMFPENSDSTHIKIYRSPTGDFYNDYLEYNTSNWDQIPMDAEAVVLGVPGYSSKNLTAADLTDYPLYRRFKPNSSICGGEGPNIEFEYVLTENVIDTYYKRVSSSPIEYKPERTDKNSRTLSGLQPNEVYRFGIVFYNKKGQASYVKWIQDIRIPYVELIDSGKSTIEYDDESLSYRGREIIANNINIKFTIKNFPDDDNIAAWQIVRVKRNAQDREILYNGLLLATHIRGSDAFTRIYLDFNSESGKYYSGKPLDRNDYDYASSEDRPLTWEFLCPEINFNKEVVDLLNCNILVNYYQLYDSYTKSLSRHDICQSIYYKTEPWPRYHSAREIQNYVIAKPPTFTGNGDSGIVYKLGDSTQEKLINTALPEYSGHGDNIGIGGTKLIISSKVFDSLGPSSLNNNNFPDNTDWDEGDYYISNGEYYYRTLYAQITKNVIYSRYGGFTFKARQNNVYIPYGEINRIEESTDTTTNFNGDTFLQMFDYVRSLAQEDYPKEWGEYDGLQEIISFPVHTSINLNFRNDNIFKYITLNPSGETDGDGNLKDMWIQETVETGIAYQPIYYNEKIGDLYSYNSVYSKQNEAKKFYPKPVDFEENKFIDTKVVASEEKINGEYTDSWLLYKTANFIEVESNYGSITTLKQFMNNLYCFQENAVSILSVNERSLVQDSSGLQLALGTGGVLTRYDYISTNAGLQSPTAIVTSKRALYFIDEYSKEIWIVQGPNLQELTRIKGFSSELNRLLPKEKITLGFDPKFNDIYFTFGFTTNWIYNEIIGSFISKFTGIVQNYFNLKGEFYSFNSVNTSSIFRHNDPNSKLGSKAYITVLINPNGNIVNQFDNLDLRTQVLDELGAEVDRTVSRITYSNSYISPITRETILSGTDKNMSYLTRMFRTQVPLTSSGKRMADTYLLVTLEFDNEGNNTFKLHDIITYYREAQM
jgi:hypothetical protein